VTYPTRSTRPQQLTSTMDRPFIKPWWDWPDIDAGDGVDEDDGREAGGNNDCCCDWWWSDEDDDGDVSDWEWVEDDGVSFEDQVTCGNWDKGSSTPIPVPTSTPIPISTSIPTSSSIPIDDSDEEDCGWCWHYETDDGKQYFEPIDDSDSDQDEWEWEWVYPEDDHDAYPSAHIHPGDIGWNEEKPSEWHDGNIHAWLNALHKNAHDGDKRND